MWNVPRGRDLASLIVFMATSLAASGVGSVFTLPALDTWYRKLRKPDWTPPDRIFGPVWTILYTQMGVAGWLVYRRSIRQPRTRKGMGTSALVAWVTQLFLNIGWSAAFFGRRSPGAGLFVVVLLWAAIAMTVATAARVSRLAGLLLLPYLTWTSFAAVLNLRVWQLNRDARLSTSAAGS
jgi:tryptophan-rich sensory protein